MSKSSKYQKDLVMDFMSAQNELFKYFNCEENFFIKPLASSKWSIKSDDDFHFLYYWPTDEKRMEAVIVKKNGEPLVFKTDKYTMVIGIDCVKIGFIFQNNNKQNAF